MKLGKYLDFKKYSINSTNFANFWGGKNFQISGYHYKKKLNFLI